MTDEQFVKLAELISRSKRLIEYKKDLLKKDEVSYFKGSNELILMQYMTKEEKLDLYDRVINRFTNEIKEFKELNLS